VDDRAALRGIVYVLCKSVSWRDVPAEQVGCSGVTAWRRLRDWTQAGVWPQLHELLPAELRAAGLLEMNDAAIDGSHVRALKGGGSHRTFAGRPRASGQQAPSDHRPPPHPLGRLADQRKPP
jgi:transposase